ncbi:MAG: helix-turn-helix domain-containing protein [Lachnospiraceae bacterium]|nr:helix-turn-helix domain-containing protein [Lachnospiraceae bacterium]
MEFGEKVRQLRKEKKISQAALAEAVGVSTRTLHSYESGDSYPRYRNTYKKLAEALSCDVNDLLMVDTEANVRDSEFISEAAEQYGSRGKKQAQQLIAEVTGCFAGGELSEEDKDEMMKAIQDAYWVAKKNNQRFTPKKYQ